MEREVRQTELFGVGKTKKYRDFILVGAKNSLSLSSLCVPGREA